MGHGFQAYPCDVYDYDACKACVEEIARDLGSCSAPPVTFPVWPSQVRWLSTRLAMADAQAAASLAHRPMNRVAGGGQASLARLARSRNPDHDEMTALCRRHRLQRGPTIQRHQAATLLHRQRQQMDFAHLAGSEHGIPGNPPALEDAHGDRRSRSD